MAFGPAIILILHPLLIKISGNQTTIPWQLCCVAFIFEAQWKCRWSLGLFHSSSCQGRGANQGFQCRRGCFRAGQAAAREQLVASSRVEYTEDILIYLLFAVCVPIVLVLYTENVDGRNNDFCYHFFQYFSQLIGIDITKCVPMIWIDMRACITRQGHACREWS